jgi:hypothetical protein
MPVFTCPAWCAADHEAQYRQHVQGGVRCAWEPYHMRVTLDEKWASVRVHSMSLTDSSILVEAAEDLSVPQNNQLICALLKAGGYAQNVVA